MEALHRIVYRRDLGRRLRHQNQNRRQRESILARWGFRLQESVGGNLCLHVGMKPPRGKWKKKDEPATPFAGWQLG